MAVTACIVGLAVLAIGGCLPETSCTLRDDGTATCGVLLGTTTQSPTPEGLASAESFMGRPFDMVYRFHEIDDQIPTDDERRLVESGRALHISIDTRVDNSRDGLTWAGVADGSHDMELSTTARGLAALGEPIFVTYDHEMDQEFKRSLGSNTDFIDAWHHVHSVFEAAGATNVIWVWVASGTKETIPRSREMWPGNDMVDWISWDVYNASGCRVNQTATDRLSTFADELDVFYRWLKTEAAQFGIDTNKPLMISEMGSVVYPGDENTTAAWYKDVAPVLRERPEIRAIGLWDHTGNQSCDYRFTGNELLQGTLRDMASSPIFANLTLTE